MAAVGLGSLLSHPFCEERRKDWGTHCGADLCCVTIGYPPRAKARFICIETVFRGLKAPAPSVKNLEEALLRMAVVGLGSLFSHVSDARRGAPIFLRIDALRIANAGPSISSSLRWGVAKDDSDLKLETQPE
jgi:hypothetical protein